MHDDYYLIIISFRRDWLFDFNVMSTRLGLFHSLRLENCIRRTFIFFVQLFQKQFVFAQLYDVKYSYLIQIIIWFKNNYV